jgi:hypothetical protein
MGILFTSAIGLASYALATAKSPQVNSLYSATSSLALTYAIGGSLLLYGMMLYLFSAFPQSAPLSILLFDVLLLLASLGTLYFNPWQVLKRKQLTSGNEFTDPAFIAIATSCVLILVIMITILVRYRDIDSRSALLLLLNLLVIPSFFLTSGAINAYALNDFTYNF